MEGAGEIKTNTWPIGSMYIQGTGIFTYIYRKKSPNIYHTWILWVGKEMRPLTCSFFQYLTKQNNQHLVVEHLANVW